MDSDLPGVHSDGGDQGWHEQLPLGVGTSTLLWEHGGEWQEPWDHCWLTEGNCAFRIFKKKKTFIWLCRVLVVSHETFLSLLQHAESLVAACELLVAVFKLINSCDMWNLVPWPGMELRPPALGAQSLSHWTTTEVLRVSINFFV